MALKRVGSKFKAKSRKLALEQACRFSTIYPQQTASAEAVHNTEEFWRSKLSYVDWYKKPEIIFKETTESQVGYQWFSDGELNVCENALDRHVRAGRGEQVCMYYDSPVTNSKRSITYSEMLQWVEQTAGALANLGVGKGDGVLLYMPMIPESVITMMACARLGAPHSVVFGGFAPAELAKRIDDFAPKVIVSANCGVEPTRVIPYKPLLDEAIDLTPEANRPEHCLIMQRPGFDSASMVPGRDLDWMQVVQQAPKQGPTIVKSTDLLYILYTSGTTGKPKGVMRDSGGHATALSYMMDEMFDCRAGDVVFSGSDIGWVVGHSFIVYAPLLAGCSTVLFEGKPVGTPDAGTYWRVVEDYKVKMLFTAPTAIRAIRRDDSNCDLIKNYDISSWKTLFLAGERMDPTSMIWLEENIGAQYGCHIIDHWWQTETGWPITGRFASKDPVPPQVIGSAGLPNPGMNLTMVKSLNEDATERIVEEVGPNEAGEILIKSPLPPGTLMGLYNDEARCEKSYFEKYPGYYQSGDQGHVDENGYLHVMSRVDDVINVAGHRLSTSQIEEVLSEHPDVAESAVIAVADQLKGEIPIGVVVCKAGISSSDADIKKQCVQHIRNKIGAVASFRDVLVVSQLPKTRSGKILRRSLKEIYSTGNYTTIPATIEDVNALDIFKDACEAQKV